MSTTTFAFTHFLLSADNRYLGSTAGSQRLRFLDQGGENHRYALLKLASDGLLVDPRSPDAYYVPDASGALFPRLLPRKTPERDRFTRAGAHIVHCDSRKIVSASRNAEGAVTLLLADPGSDAQSVSITGYTLITDVLAQTPQPYPTFSGGQAAAYSYACTLWKVSDIRTEYSNIDYNLDGQTYLLSAQYFEQNQTEFTQDDWSAVCEQLLQEIAAVDNVQALYNTWTSFNSIIFSVKNTTLDTIATELDIDTTANATIWPLYLVEGVFYALFSAMGPEIGFLANIMSAAFGVAMSGGTFSSNPITQEYADLLQALLNDYDAIRNSAANQETTILQDWGMTQAVSGYCGGPLASTPTQLAEAEQIAEIAFGAYALQGFLPQIASIGMNLFQSGSSTTSNPAVWIQTLTDDLYNEWFVVLNANNDYVPSSIMKYVWGAGVREQDFFFGQNNWSISRFRGGTTVNGWSGTEETDNDAVLLLLITNDTDQDLSVTASPLASAASQTWLTPQQLTLPANGSTMVSTAYSWGPGINVGVYWSGYSSGSVASLWASQTVNAWKAGQVDVSTYYAVQGFSLTWRTASPEYGPLLAGNGLGLPGICVISVTQQS